MTRLSSWLLLLTGLFVFAIGAVWTSLLWQGDFEGSILLTVCAVMVVLVGLVLLLSARKMFQSEPPLTFTPLVKWISAVWSVGMALSYLLPVLLLPKELRSDAFVTGGALTIALCFLVLLVGMVRGMSVFAPKGKELG
ncbi:MAG: hypothetical protein KDA57_23370 [Planctomycetales bacterium]|nr:hypothetical protein [Planctomycetales bacterium]